MLIGIDKNEVKEYVSQQDTGDVKTIFLIGNITNRQKMAMIGSIIQPDGKVDGSKLQEKAIDLVKAGVKGIKNFYDPVKKEKVDIAAITDEVIDILPLQVLYELAGEVTKCNFAEGNNVKN